jgi:hypothetical protein
MMDDIKVAGGHMTDVNTESVTCDLAELNQLELWEADVGNAYLEA